MARTVDPEQHAARRQHILDHAAALFAERGYERTTTALICQAAKVSPGKLYHYFASKKAVFLAVLTADQQQTAGLVAAGMRGADPLAALLDLVDHLAAPAAAHPIVPQLVLEAMLQARRDPEVNDVLARADIDEHEALAMLLGRAIDAGQVADLPRMTTAAWLSALVGAVFLEAALNPAFEPAEQLANLRRTVRAYLGVAT